MDIRGRVFPDLTPEDLATNLQELYDKLQDDPNNGILTDRIVYIENLQDFEAGKSFGGSGEGTTIDWAAARSAVTNRKLTDVRTFIEGYKGSRINWGTPEGIDLRTRIYTTEGNNVSFRVIKQNGDFGKRQIVLKRVDGVLELNRAKVAEKAVEQFERMIDDNLLMIPTRVRDRRID